MTKDEVYMSRALSLAKKGKGFTSPNPMVGAVIVCDGKIIGEGFHRKCGEAHAEVNAINSVKDEELLKRSTIYVTLEPCSHWGKTPPCSKLIIEKQIPRVVVGMQDPFSAVSGRGLEMIRNAGAEVVVGVLEDECVELNKAFIYAQTLKRPYVTLKWAQSADGYIDADRKKDDNAAPVVISDTINSIEVHKMRAEYDAIMVGTNTAILDNPRLNVRKWDGKNPVRVLLDRTLRVPHSSSLFDGPTETIIFTEMAGGVSVSDKVTYVAVSFDENLLSSVLSELSARGVQSLMVEGGASLLNSFLKLSLWDDARVEVGDVLLKSGVEAPVISGKKHTFYRSGTSMVVKYANY